MKLQGNYEKMNLGIKFIATVNNENRELSKSEYEEFKNGKNFYSLNFMIRLKINNNIIDNKDLENVIKEINKTFEK